MEILFEGALSVKAVILAGKRNVFCVMIDEKKKDRDTAFLIRKAQEKKIPVKRMPREKIDALASGKTHGGVLCIASERQFDSLEECFRDESPFLAILEGIEDPFNFAYALRTLYAAGCSGVLLRGRNWSTQDSLIAKSSAGASEYIRLIECADLSEALNQCKDKGFCVYCAMRKDAIDFYDADYHQPFVMAIGGEKRGLSHDVLDQADQNIMIPYANDFKNALNASSAVAAIAFEIVRQRRK